MANEIRLINESDLLKKQFLVDTVRGAGYVVAVEDIAEAPTVDAAPVVHGEWIICCDGYYPYCSVCKKEPKHGEMTNYCPNCGAKMDGERKGHDKD